MTNRTASASLRRGIICKFCRTPTRVFKVRRPAIGIIKRRRMCMNPECAYRFGTTERPDN